jgi:hypothetical protein
MAEWWRVDPPGRAEELVSWLEKLYPEDDIGLIEELYRDVLAVLPTEAVKNSFFENFELGSWVHKNRPLGARILGLWLNKWMAVFPDAHPFNDSRHHSEAYWINELATHQPDALLDAVTSPLGSALAREQASLASGKLDCPGLRPPHYEYDQEFLRSIITAIEAVAVSRPERIAALLDPLGCDADVALFLQLRAIAANGENLARLLLPLLKHPRIFKVGDGDADWLPFARAAAASMPSLSLSDRTEVESAVAGYRPEYAWALEYSRRDEAGELLWPASDKGKYLLYQLARSGQDERAILSTIGAQHLSETAKRRLSELDRKFPGEPLPEANGVRGGFVRSPIKQDYAEFMTDDQWLSAMKKYRDDANHIYDMDGVIGGARQLASVLQARTKEEPERFVTLLERVSTELNSCYAEGVLGGVRDSSVGPDVVVRAIKAARRWDDRDFDRTIGWTVQKHPAAGADPEILAFLLNSAENGEASDTAVSTSNPQKRDRVTAQELLGRDDDLSASGINGERGAAYEALASVLWEIEETLPAILALLDRRVELEPLGSVRTCMAHTINSVGKYDATRAIELLERGASKDMRMLRAHSAQHMIGWVVHHSPAVVEKFAFDLQNSDKKGLEAYGYFLESLLALLDDDRNDKFVAGFTGNSVRRQMAAYRGAGNAGSERHGDRAASWLLRLFNDPSPTVRSDAVHVGWGEVLDSPKDRSALVRAYIASPAFNDHSDHLMRELETRVSQLPDLTFEAVEKVLELSGGWTDNQRHGHHTTIYHLSRVIVELYRSVAGSTVRERKILDLFDFYLQHDFYEFRTELGAYERH